MQNIQIGIDPNTFEVLNELARDRNQSLSELIGQSLAFWKEMLQANGQPAIIESDGMVKPISFNQPE